MSNGMGPTGKHTISTIGDFDFSTQNNQVTHSCGAFLKSQVRVMDDLTTSIVCNKKEMSEKVAINSRNWKFRSLRWFYKAIKILSKPFSYIGLLDKKPSIVIDQPLEVRFKETTENNQHNNVINLNMDDTTLLQDIKTKEKSFTALKNKEIFNKEISFLDVKQNDYRNSCYLLSTLASYSASEQGRNLLKNMVTFLGDKIQVTFIHEETNTKFNIVVDNTTLIDSSGNAIYSSSDTDIDKWCTIIEKAYHGLRIFLKKAIQDCDNNDNTAVVTVVQTMLGLVPKNNALDYANSARAMSFLPSLPESTNVPEQYKQTQNIIHYGFTDENSAAQQKNIQTILENAKHKVPMNLNSRKDKTLQLAKQAIPTGHAMAVIGVATEQLKNGKLEQGVLLYDPYGKPAPSKEFHEKIINQDFKDATKIDNAASCIKFIRAKDIPKYFTEAVIAKGGFVTSSTT